MFCLTRGQLKSTYWPLRPRCPFLVPVSWPWDQQWPCQMTSQDIPTSEVGTSHQVDLEGLTDCPSNFNFKGLLTPYTLHFFTKLKNISEFSVGSLYCWWPGDVTSYGTDRSDIDFGLPECTKVCLDIKMTSYQYKNSHCKDKTVSRTCCLNNGNIHIWKDRLYVDTRPWQPSQIQYLNGIRNSMKFCNALVHNIFRQSQINFVTSAKFGSDRLSIFQIKELRILVEFWIPSKRRQ